MLKKIFDTDLPYFWLLISGLFWIGVCLEDFSSISLSFAISIYAIPLITGIYKSINYFKINTKGLPAEEASFFCTLFTIIILGSISSIDKVKVDEINSLLSNIEEVAPNHPYADAIQEYYDRKDATSLKLFAENVVEAENFTLELASADVHKLAKAMLSVENPDPVLSKILSDGLITKIELDWAQGQLEEKATLSADTSTVAELAVAAFRSASGK
ncbi:hypothetical protein [Neptuniibacter sp. QD37_11]|uniref:hypothetical protein n=1 Tax=Neptuniibacter sp. QD37_11 TaxID=3398209 RepID=UPI0039F5BB9D